MRAAVRDEILTMFPSIATVYYEKRQKYVKMAREQRLQKLIMSAIPVEYEGWHEDLPQPSVIFKSTMIPQTPEVRPTLAADYFVLNTPPTSVGTASLSPDQNTDIALNVPTSPQSILCSLDTPSPAAIPIPITQTPLYLDPLPRDPPLPFNPHPPPVAMSIEAKLSCLYRWTLFSATKGTVKSTPYLASEPREKNFEMSWLDSEADEQELVAWVREMWWAIWTRQHKVNYYGMWRRRMEKEDAKAEAEKENKQAQIIKAIKTGGEKAGQSTTRAGTLMDRLKVINEGIDTLEPDGKM